MSGDLSQVAGLASWIVTGVGFGLVVTGWMTRADAIRKQRLNDCGIALVFAGVFARVILDPDRSVLDWALGGLSIVFIAASLWRLTHTQGSVGERPE